MDKTDAVDSFKSSLEDLITIADKLSNHCKTTEDLVGIAKLALENEGQLRLLMSLVAQKK